MRPDSLCTVSEDFPVAHQNGTMIIHDDHDHGSTDSVGWSDDPFEIRTLFRIRPYALGQNYWTWEPHSLLTFSSKPSPFLITECDPFQCHWTATGNTYVDKSRKTWSPLTRGGKCPTWTSLVTKLLGIESPTNTWKWCLKYPKWIKTIKTGHLLTISHPPNPSVHLALAGMIMETTCPGTYPVYPPPTVPARRSSAIPATKDGTKLPWSCCVDLWMDDRTLRTPENLGHQWYEISTLQVWMPEYSKWWAAWGQATFQIFRWSFYHKDRFHLGGDHIWIYHDLPYNRYNRMSLWVYRWLHRYIRYVARHPSTIIAVAPPRSVGWACCAWTVHGTLCWWWIESGTDRVWFLWGAGGNVAPESSSSREI